MRTRAKAMENLYRHGKVKKAGMRKAVADGVINAEEYQEITGEAYTD